MLGGLAGTVLCGAIVGGVVSCSNGSTTTQPVQNSNSSSKSTSPIQTTSNYKLTPIAQPGVIYNQNLKSFSEAA